MRSWREFLLVLMHLSSQSLEPAKRSPPKRWRKELKTSIKTSISHICRDHFLLRVLFIPFLHQCNALCIHSINFVAIIDATCDELE